MDAAFDGLRAAIFEMYAAMVENDSRDGVEHQRRADALEGIDQVLEWRTLASFSARHLELLELLFAYWREAEVKGEVRLRRPTRSNDVSMSRNSRCIDILPNSSLEEGRKGHE